LWGYLQVDGSQWKEIWRITLRFGG
jgi:hypothetical protein